MFVYFIATADACSGVSGPNPGTCPSDQPGEPGNGYCDDNLNIAACKFDGGDCCPSANRPDYWKDHCEVLNP